MPSRAQPDPADIQNVAADWIVRCDAGLTAAEESAFRRWQAADPRHAAALASHRQTWHALDRPRRTGEATSFMHELATRAARRRARWAGVAVVAILLGGGLVWHASRSSTVPGAAGAGQAAKASVTSPEQRALSDGSRVELSAGADIAVDMSGTVRRVHLRKGAAHFQVAENKRLPFVVAAAGIEVHAVGTSFAVELREKEVDVLVTEGRVAVGRTAVLEPGRPAPDVAPAVATVEAGNRVAVEIAPRANTPMVPHAVSAGEMAERLAWRAPHLEFSHTPLADALALLNEYSARSHRPRLLIDDPALQHMRISGVFRADNTETFVRLLEASFGIRAERRGDVIGLRKLRQL